MNGHCGWLASDDDSKLFGHDVFGGLALTKGRTAKKTAQKRRINPVTNPSAMESQDDMARQ